MYRPINEKKLFKSNRRFKKNFLSILETKFKKSFLIDIKSIFLFPKVYPKKKYLNILYWKK